MISPRCSARARRTTTLIAGLVAWLPLATSALEPAPGPVVETGETLEVEVVKKGLGKEVSIRKGNKEWFMLIEVTLDNTVVVRQEKEDERYVVDESETHDRALTPGEVDTAIEDFINSVRHRARRH